MFNFGIHGVGLVGSAWRIVFITGTGFKNKRGPWLCDFRYVSVR